jgi:hypothetical protein
MMKITGLDGMTDSEINSELQRGARFVFYQYCISVVILTFKRPSNIYFIRAGESPIMQGLKFSLLSFLLGWWGIPWGPIYTIQSLWVNFGGGKDVTQDVVRSAPQGTT